MAEGKKGEEESSETMAVLDFDMLCATVALQTQGFTKTEKSGEEFERSNDDFGGVQRMWEGGVFDCFDDTRIAIESACCPCCRFGKNMKRANLGPCFLQGFIYFLFTLTILFNFILFMATEHLSYLYIGVASALLFGVYCGYFRNRIRKQFNIGGRDSLLDDCIHHLICSCCALCQESRTLEMNNVQEGVWHGRGDTICVGSYGGDGSKQFSTLQKPSILMPPTESPDYGNMDRRSSSFSGSNHSWNTSKEQSQQQPLVASSTETVQHTSQLV